MLSSQCAELTRGPARPRTLESPVRQWEVE